jgi:phosphoribosylformylglycinamidine cyclo-ligase
MPALFQWLQQQGGVADTEMNRVFNCGIGMVIVVPAAKADAIMAAFRALGETVYQLGDIRAIGADQPQTVVV